MFLSQYKFSKFGEFILRAENRELHYESSGAFDCLETPKVYCWISQQNSKVLYVGKTKSSIKGRMGQHRQGFKKTKKGQKNAKTLFALLSQGNVIEIWARDATCKPIEINGYVSEIEMNHYSIEEEFFIALLKPQMNS
jgi:hypothetical protein